jgi:hypothetical protein
VDDLISRLRALAKEERDETGMPDELRAPLSLAERDEIAAAVLAAGTPRAAAVVTPLASRRSRRRVWLAIALPVAAAAGLVLVARPRLDSNGSLPPLPTYEVSARGGMKELRQGERDSGGVVGATARPERVGRQTEIVVGCRPATAVDGPVAARAFVFRDGAAGAAGSPAEIATQVQTAPTGALEIRVRPLAGVAAGADPAARARWTLRVAVGRPDHIAKLASADAAAGTPADGPAVRWLTVPLDLVAN